MEITPGIIDLMKAAQIIAENLRDQVWKKDLMESHRLWNEINHDAVGETIHIYYLTYGMYQDMGVGRHTRIGDVGEKGTRKPIVWYSKTMYRQVARIAEAIAKELGVRSSEVMGDIGEGGRMMVELDWE